MARGQRPHLRLESFLSDNGPGEVQHYPAGARIFAQGDPPSSLFFISKGLVKLSFTAAGRRELTFALRAPGDFFGEECFAGGCCRNSSANAFSDCTIVKMGCKTVLQMIRGNPSFSETLIGAVVKQGLRQQQDLNGHLACTSEERLARLLLALAPLIEKHRRQPGIPRISQALLAEMVGTTRGRISYFMNKFRERGFVDYNGELRIDRRRLKSFLE